MTQHDPQDPIDINAWMEDARAALSPRDADQARILAALEKRLDLPPEPRARVEDSGSRLPPAAGIRAANATRVGALSHWATRVLVPLAGVGAIALIATQLHTRAPAPVLRPAKPVAAAVTEALPSIPELAADGDMQAPAQTDSKNDASPSPKRKKPQPKKCRTADGRERPCVIKSSETALAQASAPEPASPPPTAASLSQELEALRQAQRALRSGQAAQALSVLEAFERQSDGHGKMLEERAAAATMARCALAHAEQEKQGLYGEFVRHYPESAYAARLRRSCVFEP